eukprot:7566107-Pyramimonas_sp.AAC.1
MNVRRGLPRGQVDSGGELRELMPSGAAHEGIGNRNGQVAARSPGPLHQGSRQPAAEPPPPGRARAG